MLDLDGKWTSYFVFFFCFLDCLELSVKCFFLLCKMSLAVAIGDFGSLIWLADHVCKYFLNMLLNEKTPSQVRKKV